MNPRRKKPMAEFEALSNTLCHSSLGESNSEREILQICWNRDAVACDEQRKHYRAPGYDGVACWFRNKEKDVATNRVEGKDHRAKES